MIAVQNEEIWSVGDVQSSTWEKIDAFLSLEIGWRFGCGEPADAKVGVRAKKVVAIAEKNGWETDVFPGSSGELLLTADRRQSHVEIIVEIDNTLTLIREEDGRDVERLVCLTDDAVAYYLLHNGPQCVTYGYYTQETGRPKTTASTGWPLGTITNRLLVSPLSIQNARANAVDAYANISPDITNVGMRQRLFGSLIASIYQPIELSIQSPSEEMSGVTETFTVYPTKTQTKPSKKIGTKAVGKTIEFAGGKVYLNLSPKKH